MIQITIIGLGRIGASMGLALRRNAGANFTVVGHDREPTAAGHAERAGAVSRVEWNLPRACEAADVLLLALPLNEIRETLALAAPHLKSGAVALDTAPLKLPVLQWAAELLPDGRYFVGANPLLNPERLHDWENGPAAARADLFEGGLLALIPPREAPPEALKLGHDLAYLLGAAPFFLEPAEHDSLMASADALPGLLAVALIRAASASPGWRDI
ncbi:MAG: prephenate dehydrogenase, partial [Chloroflexi bacterium]|nr:prephenate dehydrogenase [Chloroflexota bacterium]